MLIGSSNSVVRSAMTHAIRCEPDLRLLAETTDPAATVAEVGELFPDVTVVLFHDGRGIDACAAIKAGFTATRVLVIGTVSDPDELVGAVEAGADGYVAVDSAFADVVAAVRRLGAGEAWIPPAMLGSLLGSLIRRRRVENAAIERLSRLSLREREVLKQLVDGLEPQAIADSLFLSRNTVRTHVQNVLQKLEVHSRLEAVRLAVESGAFETSVRRNNYQF